MPAYEKEWLDLANETQERWQLPNPFSAADWKHIALYHLHDSGAKFYDYEGFYSIVLMSFEEYDYIFIYADVGCQGRISDGGLYRNFSFAKSLFALWLKISPSRPLP